MMPATRSQNNPAGQNPKDDHTEYFTKGRLPMKPKSARYLGMTTSQLGILGGAAAVALLLICGLSWFVFSMSPASEATRPAPVATEIPSTPRPTVDVVVATPSPTPALEVATSIPPGGWVEFQTQGASIWLPNNFVGGDLTNQKQETIAKISNLGRSYKNVVSAMNNAQPEVSLWMIDKARSQSIFIATVRVNHYVRTTDQTLAQFITEDNNGDYNGTPWAMFITVNETKKMTILGREARRQTYQQHGTGLDATGIAYYIKDGADFWVVDYIMDPDEYVNELPIVEQSIGTFNLVK
jgi:hypothetical protein